MFIFQQSATPDEDNLECLCKLLTTVGQKLDESLAETEAKFKNVPVDQRPKFLPEEKCMDKFFGRLDKLSENKKISSRIRFAIMVRKSFPRNINFITVLIIR